MDWEVEKKTHWLRRAGRAVAKYWSETDIDRLNSCPGDDSLRKLTEEKVPGRGLWKMIQDNFCSECFGRGDFLQGPRGGSCSNIKCKYCGQRYWIDPLSQTAKKI